MPTSCSAGSCGTGGWTGPLPGDPGDVFGLTATPTFGGIDVAWNLPGVNPFAVAYTSVYRGTSANYALALKRVDWSGNKYFDQTQPGEPERQYFYWVQQVSVNGTLGPLVGPATAVARPTITEMIELLSGQIDESVLGIALSEKIAKITELDNGLAQEVLDRLAAEGELQGIVEGVDGRSVALSTLVVEERDIRIEQNGVLVEAMNAIAASAGGDSSAAVIAEQTVRVSEDGALAKAVLELIAANGGPGGAASMLLLQNQVQAYKDAVLAGQTVTVQGALGNNIASVQNNLQTNINVVDGKVVNIGARWTATVDVNGLVGGFGVYNNGNTVAAGFNVDTFWVGKTTTKIKPFIISGGIVYINEAAIGKLSANAIKAWGLSIYSPTGTLILDAGSTTGNFVGQVGGVLAANLVLTANNAADDATDALANAATANALVANIAVDDKVTPVEKRQIKLEFDNAAAEKAGINTQASGFGITTENTDYNNAYALMNAYVNSSAALSNLEGAVTAGNAFLSNLASTTDLDKTYTRTSNGVTYSDGGGLRLVFVDFYAARQVLLNKIAAEAALRASWASVTGTGKPENDATKGAPVGTLVGGVAAATVVSNAANGAQAFTDFNAGNNQDGSAIAAATLPGSGIVEHTTNADGSVNISFDWIWGGVEADIDGFEVYVRTSTAAGSATITPNSSAVVGYFMPATKRSFILIGAAANNYYHFGVRAYRRVNAGVNTAGIIRSSMTQYPGISPAAAYRPSSSVAFSGDVTGTVNSTPAATVVAGAANGAAALTAINNATTGLDSRLRSNGADVLSGVVSLNVVSGAAGFKAGNLTWDTAGARISGYGVAMTTNGIIAYNSAGKLMFALNATTGAASFGGSLDAASGTFAGQLTADAVNAVKTVNIAGEAVTIPRYNFSSSYIATRTITIPAGQGGARVAIIGSVAVPRGGYTQRIDVDGVTVRTESVAGGTVPALNHSMTLTEGTHTISVLNEDTEQGTNAFIYILYTMK